jgi:quercetin dioxygenase-like cupin family protein
MQAQDAIFMPAGKGETHAILGTTHTNKLSPADSKGAFVAIEISIPPRCGPPMHSHGRDSECFYVLEGEITFETPDGATIGKPGDFIFLPAGGRHAFRNDGEKTAKAFVVVTPGIQASRFFDEVDHELKGEIDVPVVFDIAGRNGIRFIEPSAAA